jgi:sialidase-1
MDIVPRRGSDRGKTWSGIQFLVDHGSGTIGNPTPVVLQETGKILLLLTANPAKAGATRSVWITSSRDDGRTWAPPREITSMAKKPEWGWYATGPGNGIELKDGRIVIPCDHALKPSRTMHSHVIHSALIQRADDSLQAIFARFRSILASSLSPRPSAPAISMNSGCMRVKTLSSSA